MDRSGLIGSAVAAVVLLAATGFGLWRRRRDGAPRPVAAAEPAGSGEPTAAGERQATRMPLAELGVTPAPVATLLQFSSAFCAPCRATRVVCRRIAAGHDGVRHAEVDAESQLDAVRALGVWRTPTVFVLDPAGRPLARIVGQPTRAQVVEALTPLLAGAGR